MEIELAAVPHETEAAAETTRLFSESNSRFLCEVLPEEAATFEALLTKNSGEQIFAVAQIGSVTKSPHVVIRGCNAESLVDLPLKTLKDAWQTPLAW